MNVIARIRGVPQLPETLLGWWDALEHKAAEPAFTATRPWLHAALTHLPAHRRPRLLSVAAQDGLGLAAITGVREGWRYGGLGRIASTCWVSFFCHGVPLIDGRRPEWAVAALLENLSETGAALAEFPSLPLHGPFLNTLRTVTAREGLSLVLMKTWERAFLDATQTPDEWETAIPRKRRKEWRRLRRRLQERGETVFEVITAQDDAAAWLDEFLLLERSGWKGRAGTAIACDPALTAMVRDALSQYHAEGRLRFWRLRHAGRTIASLFGRVHKRTLLLDKIAYDEDFAAFSPGVLLTLHATRSLIDDPDVDAADSCAIPDHPMINHIWKQRLAMADVLVQLPGTGHTRTQMLIALEKWRRAARERAKALWHASRAPWPRRCRSWRRNYHHR
ncbi:GNAT family N-acetyltransferase [Thermopetrobacter sp. TC1]|uniref:GNAT family N-acetyltransferase n=1 Tax=Thermopetrobacter sp. TC1 TaxID=1495045 RepID=UPI00068A15D3|nr:GNAT family N-acetyltransferase [Thermopetrobacter sp. TC1]